MGTKFNYKQWIKDQDFNKKDWILVAQEGKSSENELYHTRSVIVDMHKVVSKDVKEIKKMVKLVVIPGEESYFLKKAEPSQIKAHILSDFYIPNDVIDVGDISRAQRTDEEINNFTDFHIIKSLIVRPFAHFLYEERIGTKFELDLRFPLYYNALRVKDEYLRIDENGDQVCIARIKKEGGKVMLYVSSIYLCDYLTLSGYALWRYHSHLIKADIKEEDIGEFEFQTENSRYKVFVGGLTYWDILLRGQELLLPFNKDEYKPLLIRHFYHYESYITGLDEKGNEIVHSCKLKHPHKDFFIPVYFKQELLKHFYDNPQKYTVLRTYIRGGEQYTIDYSRVDEYIQVYLGDLSRLPPKEQKLWKSYNVALKEKKITRDRIERDFYAQFSAPEDIIDDLKIIKTSINEKFMLKFGFKLFKDLNKPDQYREKQLHIPITNDWDEFNGIIESLAIIFVDSINNNLKKILKRTINEAELKKLKSIDLFEEFLKTTKLPDEDIIRIINSFKLIYNIRSQFASHRTASEYEKALKKLGFSIDQKKSEVFGKIIENLNKNLAKIVAILESAPI